jgi:hypothetical protein
MAGSDQGPPEFAPQKGDRMLSAKLVRFIENHWEPIAIRAIQQIRSSPEVSLLSGLSEAELRARARELAANLGHWLSVGSAREMAARYEELGRHRFAQGIPLSQVVRGLQIVRVEMTGYVRDQGIGATAVDLYAEEELENRLALFFDDVIYHSVRGYESAVWEKLPETPRRNARSA